MSEFRLRGDEGFYDLLGLMRAWAGMWERSGVSRREAFEVALDALDKLGLPSSHPLVSEPDLPGMWEEADLSGGATDQEASKPETEPVAEVVECPTMGGQTLREIDGRWKFLKTGTKLYTLEASYVRGYQDGVAAGHNSQHGLKYVGADNHYSKEASKAVPVADEREAFDVWFRADRGLPADADTGPLDSAYLPWRAWKARAAIASQPEPTSKGVPDDVLTYFKAIYEFLQSTAPDGFADEAFRLPPSPTRAQAALFDAATGNAAGERAGLARQDQGNRPADSRPVEASQQRALSEAQAHHILTAAQAYADQWAELQSVEPTAAKCSAKVIEYILAASSGSKGGGE